MQFTPSEAGTFQVHDFDEISTAGSDFLEDDLLFHHPPLAREPSRNRIDTQHRALPEEAGSRGLHAREALCGVENTSQWRREFRLRLGA